MTSSERPWERPVADAANDPAGEPASLDDVLREELEALWGDLDQAYKAALNGMWSMGCDWLVTRIVRLTRFAGVTPPGATTFPLLLNGVYEGVLDAAGIAHEPVDLDEMRRIAVGNGYQQCAECELWDGHHTRPCSQRRRSAYERDQERLAKMTGAGQVTSSGSG